MALTDYDIAKMLIKIRDKFPEIYRHIIGVITSLVKEFE